jgi:hypothetical protein
MTTAAFAGALSDITSWRLFLELSNKSTQALCIGIGATLVVIGALLQRPGAQVLANTPGPSIVAFEFAGTQPRAYEALRLWGPNGQQAAKTMLITDSILIAGYVTLLGSVALTFAETAAQASRSWVGVSCRFLAIGVAAAGMLDLIENAALLHVMAKYRRLSDTQRALTATMPALGLGPGIAKICAQIKFVLLGVVIAALLFLVFPIVAFANNANPNKRPVATGEAGHHKAHDNDENPRHRDKQSHQQCTNDSPKQSNARTTPTASQGRDTESKPKRCTRSRSRQPKGTT